MNKFDAKAVAVDNGWSEKAGYALFNKSYRETVPTGELEVHLDIGYELSNDNESDDEATLVVEHRMPSTAHPPLASRCVNFRRMDAKGFASWLDRTAKELIEAGCRELGLKPKEAKKAKVKKELKFDVVHVRTEFNVPHDAVIVTSGVGKEAAIAMTADYFQKEWDRYFANKGRAVLVDHLNRFLADDGSFRIWEHEAAIDTHNGPDNSSNYIFFRESGKGVKGWKR